MYSIQRQSFLGSVVGFGSVYVDLNSVFALSGCVTVHKILHFLHLKNEVGYSAYHRVVRSLSEINCAGCLVINEQ